MTTDRTCTLIIGGGATGAGVARDLALRGVEVVLVDQRDLTAGASGANHGLLHSGGRYVSGDPESARHCKLEGDLQKRLAPHLVEDTGGLFVAVEGDDERFIADFPGFCARSGVPATAIDPAEARALEPNLTDRVIAAFVTEDGSIDPFKLVLENLADAVAHGARVLTHRRVVGFERVGRRIEAVVLRHVRTGETSRVVVDEVVNAAGAWSAEVTEMVVPRLNVLYSKGTLVVTQQRLTHRVVNRLRKPSNADIIVPGGTVSVLGTTSQRIDDLGCVEPTLPEVDLILDECALLVPGLAEARLIRAFAGVRPLVAAGGAGDDRSVSRDLTLLDHGAQGVDNLVTITGGKLTTYRYMAEKAADLVCAHLGVTTPCATRTEPLPERRPWTVPGRGARTWLLDRDDPLLCECEMVPRSAVAALVADLTERGVPPTLLEVALRSRVGKGSCQGCWCSLRVASHLAATGSRTEAVAQVRAFLEQRWKGERPILWGERLGQAELKEAIHCAFYGLEGAP